MHRPVCVQCSVEMRCAVNGVPYVEVDGEGNPYKLWSTDKYACPKCGNMVLTGFAAGPMAESWQPYFKRMLENYKDDENLITEVQI